MCPSPSKRHNFHSHRPIRWWFLVSSCGACQFLTKKSITRSTKGRRLRSRFTTSLIDDSVKQGPIIFLPYEGPFCTPIPLQGERPFRSPIFNQGCSKTEHPPSLCPTTVAFRDTASPSSLSTDYSKVAHVHNS